MLSAEPTLVLKQGKGIRVRSGAILPTTSHSPRAIGPSPARASRKISSLDDGLQVRTRFRRVRRPKYCNVSCWLDGNHLSHANAVIIDRNAKDVTDSRPVCGRH
jgi:hypothetical protein